MAKNCSRCSKELSFRNSFIWKEMPVCSSCLLGLEQGQEWDKVAEPAEIPARKSIVAAVLLALFFGPLGALYVRGFLHSFTITLLFLVALIVMIVVMRESVLIILLVIVFGIVELIVLPLWAGLRAKAINEEAELARNRSLG